MAPLSWPTEKFWIVGVPSKGTLDVLVLKALARGPLHGWGVAGWIRETTERRRWLESEWGISETGRRVNFYQVTEEGRRALASECGAWTRYAEAMFKVLPSDLPGRNHKRLCKS